MSIKVEPSKFISRLASDRKIKRLFRSKGVSLKRSALAFVKEIDFVNVKEVEAVALQVIKDYKARIKAEKITEAAVKRNPKLLISRVQSEVIFNLSKGIKKKYSGEKYRWLPSDAETPDPEHQLKYGNIYTIGEGEMPGERFGCKCGMEILTEEEELEI